MSHTLTIQTGIPIAYEHDTREGTGSGEPEDRTQRTNRMINMERQDNDLKASSFEDNATGVI